MLSRIEIKEFSVFSKPFNMPFKISDLIFFSGQKYCFIQAPEEIKDELQGLNMKNVNFTETNNDCSEDSKKICFASSAGCDTAVYSNGNFESGYINKEGKTLYYVGPLIYAALFSSPEIYECNVKRLMLRLTNLCFVYKDKIKILEKKDCSSLLDSHLTEMINLARDDSQSLLAVKDKAEEIEQINKAAVCKVF